MTSIPTHRDRGPLDILDCSDASCGARRARLGALETACSPDSVYSDRHLTLGGEPVTGGRAEFVEGWRQAVQNLDEGPPHDHLSRDHAHGDQAACSANMMGNACVRNHLGPSGRAAATLQLQRTNDGWKISGLTVNIQGRPGNINIVNLAVAEQT